MGEIYEVIEGPVNLGDNCYGPGDIIRISDFQAKAYLQMGRIRLWKPEEESKKKGR